MTTDTKTLEAIKSGSEKSSIAAKSAAERAMQEPYQLTDRHMPTEGRAFAIDPGDIPQNLSELTYTDASSYELSVSAAAELSIPVIGGVSGGFNRRVVVYEHAQYKPIIDSADETELRYGLAIRFCVTVNKLDTSLNVSVPFLAAKAQLGQIEARWIMQVRGLAGQPLTSLILPPQDLDVETFVLAKQSMAALIGAIYDPETSFTPGIVIARIKKTEMSDLEEATLQTFALTQIAQRRSQSRALRARQFTDAEKSIIAGVYGHFDIPTETRPTEDQESRAEQLLGGLFR